MRDKARLQPRAELHAGGVENAHEKHREHDRQRLLPPLGAASKVELVPEAVRGGHLASAEARRRSSGAVQTACRGGAVQTSANFSGSGWSPLSQLKHDDAQIPMSIAPCRAGAAGRLE